MPCRKFSAPTPAAARGRGLGWVALCAAARIALSNPAAAADANPESSLLATSAAPTLPPITAPKWTDLLETDRQVLLPLAPVWDEISTTRGRKWRSIVKNYPQLSPSDQAKIRKRMGEWSLLSPKERQRARLNFAHSKNVNPQELASNWETYQSLSEADRKALSDRTPPVPKDKLATIAVTRHSTDAQRATASAVQPIDRKTLLPLWPVALAKPAAYGGA